MVLDRLKKYIHDLSVWVGIPIKNPPPWGCSDTDFLPLKGRRQIHLTLWKHKYLHIHKSSKTLRNFYAAEEGFIPVFNVLMLHHKRTSKHPSQQQNKILVCGCLFPEYLQIPAVRVNAGGRAAFPAVTMWTRWLMLEVCMCTCSWMVHSPCVHMHYSPLAVTPSKEWLQTVQGQTKGTFTYIFQHKKCQNVWRARIPRQWQWAESAPYSKDRLVGGSEKEWQSIILSSCEKVTN